MSSRSLGSLTIDLIAKIAGFEQGMDRAARTADRRMKQIERSAKVAGAAIGAIGGAAIAGVSVIVRNTMQAEKSLAQLDAILKSTGNAAGYTRNQLVSMAQEFQQSSTFGTNEIIDAQTRLLSYSGILGENIPRAMQAVIDQAERLGMSVSQSAETIGRALESPSKAAAALAQQGFGAAFTKEVRASIDALVAAGREGEAQIKILEILEESYGGAAEAARNTFGGALSALQNTLGDLLSGDDDSLTGLTQAINELIDTLNDPDVRKGFQFIVNGATEAATAVVNLTSEFGRAISKYREWLADAGRLPADMLDNLDQLDTRIRKLAQMQYGSGILNDIRRAIFGDSISEELRKAVARRNILSRYPDGLPDFSNVITGANEARGGGGGGGVGDRPKGKSEAQREAERLQNAYDSLMSRMHETIELFGKEGEAAKVRYEIEHGALKGLSEPLAQLAIQRAEQIDQMRELDELQKAAKKAADDEVRRIQDGLKAGKDLLDDLQFELELMRMTNSERATAIQLRGLEAEAVAEYGEAIAEANRKIEEELKNIRFMDGIRNEFSDFVTDVVTGASTIQDAFKGMLDNIARMITQRIADNWAEQLFGSFGSSAGGSTGGWFSSLMGLFRGGKASGGWAQPNSIYEVNERGLEMATVRGRDYLLTGNSPVQITPNHQLGAGGSTFYVTNNFNRPVTRSTGQQISLEIAQKTRLATIRDS